jgi:hypothetical protein
MQLRIINIKNNDMKTLLLTFCTITFFSCNNTADKTPTLQNRIDSLESKLAKTYKPGLGEFMSSIQVHHAKLWFAGENENWQLADFEIGEIKESLEDISTYCSERPEVQKIGMIEPAIDSISHAIQLKNPAMFKTGFILLTATCNNCHHATNHAFNVIKTPDNPPFSNQDFKVRVPD